MPLPHQAGRYSLALCGALESSVLWNPRFGTSESSRSCLSPAACSLLPGMYQFLLFFEQPARAGWEEKKNRSKTPHFWSNYFRWKFTCKPYNVEYHAPTTANGEASLFFVGQIWPIHIIWRSERIQAYHETCGTEYQQPHIVDVIHKHHVTNGKHSTSAPNERVWRTGITQLAKLSFNHPSVVLTADVFQYFYKKNDHNLREKKKKRRLSFRLCTCGSNTRVKI